MDWPSAQDLKDYLRVQTAAEDGVIAELNDAAKAAVLGFIDRPVDVAVMVSEDRAATLNAYAGVRNLYTSDWPLDLSDTPPVITDREGTVVDATTYSWLGLIGKCRANLGVVFWNGPYTITARVGLVFAPDFLVRVQPLLRRAVLDLGAVYYQQRNANATAESEEGVSASWGSPEIPPRVCAMLANLRRPSQRVGNRVSYS